MDYNDFEFHIIFICFITPANKYIKVVIPAKVLRQAQDHELAEWPESRRALDAPGSSPGQAYQVRHDGVSLFNCRVNKLSKRAISSI